MWLHRSLLELALVFIFYKAMSFSFPKMGIARRLVIPAFVGTLIGGLFNVPIWRSGNATLAVNVGGAIIPLCTSIYLLRKAPLLKTALAVAAVATVSAFLSNVEAGGAITIRVGIAPLAAVGVALILAGRNAPQVAFISGTIGVTIGGDLIHLGEAFHGGAGYLAIGGRGVFDGIFTTGIIAASLAELPWRKKRSDGQVTE